MKRAFVVLCLLFTGLVEAQTPPTSKQDGPFEVSVTGGGIVTLAGGDATILPSAWIETNGPFILGDAVVSRCFARIGLNSEPGQDLNLANPETFKAGEFSLGVEHRIGRKESDGQLITTGLVGEWGASSRLSTGRADNRLSRHYGAGLRLTEHRAGATITILYGRDEAAGDRGWGQWLFYGQLPLKFTSDIFVLTADSTVSMGPSTAKQRDILRFGAFIDGGAVIAAIKKPAAPQP